MMDWLAVMNELPTWFILVIFFQWFLQAIHNMNVNDKVRQIEKKARGQR